MLYLQMIGRGLRTYRGKIDCLILDHSETTLQLGFVTDVHYDELDDGSPRAKEKRQRKKKKPLPKECTSCHGLRPAGVRKCPHCGFEPKPQSEEDAGELEELTAESGDKPKVDMATKQRWYSMLTHYARRRGLKPGWVAHTYRKKFKVWPRGLADVPREPDAEVLGYIKHLMIAYSHAKKTRDAA
jgi:superfamily II DNA or RNA helicase